MTRLLLALAMCAFLSAPAMADTFHLSQDALNTVQLADAYSISRMTWKGDGAYDQMAPTCAKTAVREFACQAIAIVAIRSLEKPSKGTTIANFFAAAAYTWYIHKAVGATILSIRF
jgi:hypothetical protein